MLALHDELAKVNEKWDLTRGVSVVEAAGGELSRCIGIISYSSLRIAAGIVNTIPAAIFI